VAATVKRDEETYAREVGEPALERQRAEAAERLACCGEPKAEGHHPLCRNYVEPVSPEHIDGQESLL
jgi:hypothetical protein